MSLIFLEGELFQWVYLRQTFFYLSMFLYEVDDTLVIFHSHGSRLNGGFVKSLWSYKP